MKEYECSLLILSLLEKESLKTNQLYDNLYEKGYTKNERNLTTDRDLGLLLRAGIDISQENHYWVLNKDDTYIDGVSLIVKEVLTHEFPNLVHGEVLQSALSGKLVNKEEPAGLLYNILYAMKNNRLLNYIYTPQHPDTISLVKEKAGEGIYSTGLKDGTYKVIMLPRLFVFGGDNMVILGERYKDKNSEPALRQYDLIGMESIQIGETKNKEIVFDKDILYKSSFYFWQGGIDHTVTIEDVNGNQTTRKVNGEDEILSYVAASLGQKKLVNPSEEILKKAKEYKIPMDYFTFRS